MEKTERQKKRNDSCNKDNDDGSRKAEQRPKDDFSGHETTNEGSKLTSASELKNDPKKEKVQDNKKETTDAKQDKNQVKEEHKVKEKVKREQEAKEEHKEREKFKKQQKQEKIEKERENKDIKEEEKAKETNTEEEKKEIEKAVKYDHKDEVKSKRTYKEKEPKQKTEERAKIREEVRKEEKEEEKKDKKEDEKEEERKDEKEEEKEEERKDEKKEEKVEEKEEDRKDEKEEEQEEERKELRDDASPTVQCMLDDDRKDIIEKHPILVRLLSSESSPSKNPERSASVSACASSPRSGIPKRIPLAGARRSVSPPALKNVYREISPPPKVRRSDSPSFPEEHNVGVLSPRKNTPEDPLPKAPVPDSASLADTCIPCRFGLKRNIVVGGAISRARQSRNDCPGSRDRDNKVDPGFDQRDRPPPSDRPAPRNASTSPSPKKSKDQRPSSKKPAKEHPSPEKET